MKALIITAENFEDCELFVPKETLENRGWEVRVATPEKGHQFHGKHGRGLIADLTLREVNPDDYELLILPGGKAPETLRRDEHALKIAKDFFKAGKPVAAICHGPQILVSARLLEGRRATCYKTVARELKDNGAIYEDTEVVVDGNLITSREPGDLPAFMREVLKAVQEQAGSP
jgi:protease I